MFDFIHDVIARMQAQSHFGAGGGPAFAPAPAAAPAPAPAPSWWGGGSAAPGVLSPTAATVVDEPYTGLTPEEEYRQRMASMQARSAGGAMSGYERAMARARGEHVEEMPITPALGSPTTQRAPRSVAEVIAEAMATHKPAPSTPVPPRERPYSGLSPEEEYRMRREALDRKMR